jgi:hypothetical protein
MPDLVIRMWHSPPKAGRRYCDPKQRHRFSSLSFNAEEHYLKQEQATLACKAKVNFTAPCGTIICGLDHLCPNEHARSPSVYEVELWPLVRPSCTSTKLGWSTIQHKEKTPDPNHRDFRRQQKDLTA